MRARKQNNLPAWGFCESSSYLRADLIITMVRYKRKPVVFCKHMSRFFSFLCSGIENITKLHRKRNFGDLIQATPIVALWERGGGSKQESPYSRPQMDFGSAVWGVVLRAECRLYLADYNSLDCVYSKLIICALCLYPDIFVFSIILTCCVRIKTPGYIQLSSGHLRSLMVDLV